MTTLDTFLELERAFWLRGPDFYDTHLADDCLMTFPMGTLTRREIIESIAAAPRWTTLAIADPHLIQPAPATAILAYRATARRDNDTADYQTHASSVYVRDGEQWKMAFHQQTPIGG